MILKSSHIIITFGVGFGASSITEGAPIVLLILVTTGVVAALWVPDIKPGETSQP